MYDVLKPKNLSSEFFGCQEFNLARTASLVCSLSYTRVFKTKLNKLMFYCDFLSFKGSGKSISGLPYARIPYGPVPHNYEFLFSSLETMGVLQQTLWENETKSGSFIHANKKIDPAHLLSNRELDIIYFVGDYFKLMSPTQIKEFSHREKAWLECRTGQIIPYKYAVSLQIDNTAAPHP